MKREETSEEKLLNLIRQKNKSGGIITQEADNGGSSKTKRLSKLKGFRFLELCSVVLIALSIGCAAYIAGKYFYQDQTDEQTRFTPAEEGANGDAIVNRAVQPELKPFSVYEKKLKQRNIFEMQSNQPKLKAGNINKSGDVLSKKLRIVGILIDDDSKAIIEDIKTGQSVIVSEGERIGDAVLEEIQDDKLIFDYMNKKVELSP